MKKGKIFMYRIILSMFFLSFFCTASTSMETEFSSQEMSGIAIEKGRPRENIQRTVYRKKRKMKRIYTGYLKKNDYALSGKVTFKWAIDEYGKVLFVKIVSSTLNCENMEACKNMEADLLTFIKTWNFGKIDIVGDVTEVVYPFVFQP